LELCEKIKPLNIVWSGQARTNILNDKIAKAIKGAGCIGIGFGYESGSNRLLKAMNKNLTVEVHKRATKAAIENDLSIRVQIMFGYPGENRESKEETISFFKDIEIPPRRFNVFTPLPGSEIYDECLEKKIITDEDAYLKRISEMEAGFGSKKVLLNLTEMSYENFGSLLNYAEKTMDGNYKKILMRKNRLWFLQILKKKLLRYFKRSKKIISLTAWKRKFKTFGKLPEQMLSKGEIENMSQQRDNVRF